MGHVYFEKEERKILKTHTPNSYGVQEIQEVPNDDFSPLAYMVINCFITQGGRGAGHRMSQDLRW